MIFIGDVLVCALWAVQNVPYMVVIGDVFVYVAQNIHPGGCIAFQDDFVFALGAAQKHSRYHVRCTKYSSRRLYRLSG